MEENSQSLPTSFRKLSIKKTSRDPPEEEKSQPVFENVSKALSKQGSISISSQISLGDEDLDEQMLESKYFGQRKRKLDPALLKELKAVKMNIQQEVSEDKKIQINLKPQRRYKEETKAKVVELATKIGPHQVSLKTGIPETSIRRWGKTGVSKKSGSGRPPQHSEIEAELVNVFRGSRNTGLLVTNNSLLIEARKIAERLKKKDFSGTLSWLEGVKRRNGITYRKTTRVGQTISPNAQEEIEEFHKKFVELYEKHQYPLGTVFNIDETGINFEQVSNYTLDFKVFF